MECVRVVFDIPKDEAKELANAISGMYYSDFRTLLPNHNRAWNAVHGADRLIAALRET